MLVYEGSYVNDSFIVDYTQQNQQFILSNPNIDLSTLVVTVYENSTTGTIYSRAQTLYNLQSNSNIYFVQAAQDQQYEILFGDNIFGHKPLNNSLVTANYRIASGNIADGVSSFTMTYNLGSYNGGTATINGSIATLANSSGGANQESIDSIKFNAPRYFATQERAVTSDDYSSLILSNFGGYISDVAVYGGELLTPKQYGTVAVCLKPTTSSVAPDYIKSQITNFLLNYISLPNKIVLTDPDYFYCQVNTNILFSSSSTNLTVSDIQNEVLNTITNYSDTYLNSFNKDFRYSKFIAAIDNTDSSIISNDTTVVLIKRIVPQLNIAYSYVINYNNTASLEDASLHLVQLPASADEPCFYSSTFTYVDSSGNQYPNSILRDDNYGNLVIYNKINGVVVYLPAKFGTINYTTGQVQITNLNISAYSGNYISFYMELQNTDILVSLNQVLEIDPNDVTITVTTS